MKSEGGKDEPFFKFQDIQLNVTAVEGRTAALTCSVYSLQDRQVKSKCVFFKAFTFVA